MTGCGSAEMCPSGMGCCAITGVCYDPTQPALCALPPEGTDYPCVSDEQCVDLGYCQGPGCGIPGGCAQSKGECTSEVAEVCGCDGKTYLNAGCADVEHVRVASEGPCQQ